MRGLIGVDRVVVALEEDQRRVRWTEQSDAELVTALTSHNEDAFAELFRRHANSVIACARMVLGTSPHCEDVATEVFISLWNDPETFDPTRGALLTFLRVKTKGRSIDLLRAESARLRRETTDYRRDQIDGSDVGSAMLTDEASTELHAALRILSAEEREPIELAFFHHMSYKDVAAHLGLAEGTVKSRIKRGLNRLRVAYEGRVTIDEGRVQVTATTDELIIKFTRTGSGLS